MGGILFQTKILEDGTEEHQTLALMSKKLSDAATRWDTYKREAYALYAALKAFAYYLLGKEFILETDHNNLLWMNQSESDIISRWRLHMQSFNFMLRHISGVKNSVADFLSRMNPNSYLIPPKEEDLVVNSSSLSFKNNFIPINSSSDLPNNDSKDLLINSQSSKESVLDANKEVFSLGLMSSSHFQSKLALCNEFVKDPNIYEYKMQFHNTLNALTEVNIEGDSIDDLLKQVHSHRSLHFAVQETWRRAKIAFPNVRISMKQVQDFLLRCAICEKTKRTNTQGLKARTLSIFPSHIRRALGVDLAAVTPEDNNGNSLIILLTEHFSHFPQAYAVKSYDAPTLARTIFKHISIFGVFDLLVSDPGSNLMSGVLKELLSLLGIHHKVSLVERHQSNGVENSIKHFIRHLRTLVFDDRIIDRWSDEIVIATINFALCMFPSAEMDGISPFEMKYGSFDSKYFKWPNELLPEKPTEVVKLLNDTLQAVRNASQQFQEIVKLSSNSIYKT